MRRIGRRLFFAARYDCDSCGNNGESSSIGLMLSMLAASFGLALVALTAFLALGESTAYWFRANDMCAIERDDAIRQMPQFARCHRRI
jgi:hypothetical protein